jgi:ribosomal protein S18 acetylase RimI-like enzyme
MVKFDWLAWWAGRHWGEGMIRMVGATPQRAQRHAERAAGLNPWVLRVAVAAAFLPGVPAPVVFAVAGISGMPLLVFLVLDLAGALVMAALVAGLGYGLGQHAVDMVLLIDRYATWVSLALIGATFVIPWARGLLRRRHRPHHNHPRPVTPTAVVVRSANPNDADTVAGLVSELAAHQQQSEHVTAGAASWQEVLNRPEVMVLLAEVDGEPVGYVSALVRPHLWTGQEILALDDLYVRPAHRDRAVGRRLMHELARCAAGRTISWGVQPDNHAAIRFYRGLGATVSTKVTCTWPPARQGQLDD